MQKSGLDALRADAQRRVREIFERQAARLERRQEETRRHDELAQGRALKTLEESRRAIEESRREALERHDRLWEEERKKLSPAAGPSFGFGGPPRRPDPKMCKEIEERFMQARREIERQHEERLNARREQAERMREEFARASEARRDQQAKQKEELFREQAASFERRVDKELDRSDSSGGEKSLTREFGRHSPDKGPDIAG
jgi:hypothetical protein